MCARLAVIRYYRLIRAVRVLFLGVLLGLPSRARCDGRSHRMGVTRRRAVIVLCLAMLGVKGTIWTIFLALLFDGSPL